MARWEVFAAIATESQVFTKEGLGTKQVAIDTNEYIVEAAAKTLGEISSSSTSPEDLFLIRLVVLSFRSISKYPDYFSDETLSTMIEVLMNLKEKENALNLVGLDPVFTEDLVTVLGDLMSLNSANSGSLSTSVSRRQLQTISPSTQIKNLISL